MTKRCPPKQVQWHALLMAAFLAAPALFGSTINPVAINPSGGGPYVSTSYVSGSPVTGFDGLGNGNFTFDNEIQWFSFTIGIQTDIYIQTISWATLGGFTPELTLFKADGSATGIGGSSSPGTFPACGSLGVVNSLCLDAFIQATVDPGNYLLAVTQAGNTSLGTKGDGFFFDAVNSPCQTANYTGSSCLGYGGAGAFYAAYTGNPQLNGTWALSVGTPEPAPGILIFFGFAALLAARRLPARLMSGPQAASQVKTYNAWRAE